MFFQFNHSLVFSNLNYIILEKLVNYFYLFITKRALPLIKDLNPTIKTIKTKINEFKTENKQLEKKELTFKEKPVQKNNSLTFFK